MCGAGTLPARMAEEARRQGWRIVAFTAPQAEEISTLADRVIPGRLTDVGPILSGLQAEQVSAVLFAGRFAATEVLRRQGDAAFDRLAALAGSLLDVHLLDAVVATLGNLGISVLDQRPFLGDWLCEAGCLSTTQPSEADWADIRRGIDLARQMADARVGQTVVLKRGVVAAVEALEGTTAAIRRGTELAGQGSIIVKAVAGDHDYRFDTPGIGPDTLEAAARGGAAAVAIEADRVLVLDRTETVRLADAAGVALVSTGNRGHGG